MEIQPILESLESLDENQIAAALQQAEKSAELQARLEKRYLKLIRVLLDDNAAQLSDFAKVFGNEDRIEKTRDHLFITGDNEMEIVYFSDDATRDAIDIVGTIVSNHINVNDYIEHCRNTKELDEVGSSLFPMVTALQVGINEEVEAYAQGWYGAICIGMMKSMINGVGELVVMKSWVDKANQSGVLKEFSFFLGACSEKDYMFIEHRNVMDNGLDLTEMMWLYANRPLLFYPKKHEIKFPPCSLPYNRMVRLIQFSGNFYEPDGSISVKNMIARDGLQEINSEDL